MRLSKEFKTNTQKATILSDTKSMFPPPPPTNRYTYTQWHQHIRVQRLHTHTYIDYATINMAIDNKLWKIRAKTTTANAAAFLRLCLIGPFRIELRSSAIYSHRPFVPDPCFTVRLSTGTYFREVKRKCCQCNSYIWRPSQRPERDIQQ